MSAPDRLGRGQPAISSADVRVLGVRLRLFYNGRHVAPSPLGGVRPLVLYHRNPVKAGLVSRPEDGPWSSVHDYTGTIKQAPITPSGLAVDRALLPADPRTRI